jgi:TetR/AcrR family transcriptional repressor of mexJK operon
MPTSPTSAPAAKRATRITKRGQDRRAQLLKLASERFLERGYDAVSMDELVKEIGGSKTNVYKHFGNKEGLFIAVIEGLCRDLLDEVLSAGVETDSLEEGLRRLITAFAKIMLDPRQVAFHRLIVAESARFPSVGKTWFERGALVSRSAFVRLFENQHRKGNIGDGGNLERMAAQIHGAIVFQLLTCPMILGTAPEKKDVKTITDTLVAMAAKTVGARSAG